MKNKFTTVEITMMAVFAAILCVSAYLSIPTPLPNAAHITLLNFMIMLIALVFEVRDSTIIVALWMILGAVGVPVFAGFSGGIGSLFGNAGGYIIGFLVGALVMWGMEKVMGRKTWALAVQMVVGLIVCYAFGTAWFMIMYTRSAGPVGLVTVLGWCVFPFIIPDLIKIVVALGLTKSLKKVLPIMQ